MARSTTWLGSRKTVRWKLYRRLERCFTVLVTVCMYQFFFGTHLRRKIHCQLPVCAIAPPTRGPMTKLNAMTPETKLTYVGHLGWGTNSKNTSWTRAKTPQPPIPWTQRNMMSCTNVWLAAQAPENTVNMRRHAMMMTFRDTMSESFAHINWKPWIWI